MRREKEASNLQSRPAVQANTTSATFQAKSPPICHGSFRLRETAASSKPATSGTKLYATALSPRLKTMAVGKPIHVGGPRLEDILFAKMEVAEVEDVPTAVESEGARKSSALSVGIDGEKDDSASASGAIATNGT